MRRWFQMFASNKSISDDEIAELQMLLKEQEKKEKR